MHNLSNQIPVFPLSGVLLLPSGSLPLNIFEPRYISMINYSLSHDKLIGMIQPKNENSKELFNLGCVGKITTYNETDDNRYIISLKGLSKFKIISEIQHSEVFRLFNIEYVKKENDFNKFDNKIFNKQRFIEKIKFFFKKKGFVVNLDSFDQINNKSLVIMIAMICPFSVNEKQALLECKNINTLANTIISLFDFELNRINNYETIN